MMAMLCSDCALWAANRDDSGADQHWHDLTANPMTLAYIGAFVPDIGEDEEGYHAFSTRRCDGCGSTLAGARIEAHWPDAAMLGTVYGLAILETVLS